MYTAAMPQQYNSDAQSDWVDAALTVDTWLTDHMGAKGARWDYWQHSQLQQIVFEREQDCVWFVLRWSAP